MATKSKKVHAKPKAAPKKETRVHSAPPAAAAGAAQAAERPSQRIGSTPQLVRGMRDILPSEQKYWRHIYKKIESLARSYGYERIDTPIIEETGLFARTVGKQSDIVEKEMFSFLDKSNDNIALRPEGTAPVARAFINHGMFTMPQPVKLFYVGPMFRYERPQHGRTRQHHQFGVEVFGDPNAVIDAEVILLAHLFYKDLGIKTAVQINSLGCKTCRQQYMNELVSFYKSKRSQLCEDCKRRLGKNPLRLLDCKDPGCMTLKESAPHTVDFLDEECKNHFMRVLEYLDDLQAPYVLNPHLVRGLDYYSRTVFEIVTAEEGDGSSQSALGGGGRYDGLVELLGGRPTPACGFGIGIERAILQMKAQQIEPVDDFRLDIFLAQLGDAARKRAFALFEDLRAANITVAGSFSKNSLKGQLESANRLGARYTAIIGQKEVLDGTVLIRDMESGMQEIIAFDKAVSDLRKKLGRTN